jgi:hypothetical protein
MQKQETNMLQIWTHQLPKARLLVVPDQDSDLMDKVIMFMRHELLQHMRHLQQELQYQT